MLKSKDKDTCDVNVSEISCKSISQIGNLSSDNISRDMNNLKLCNQNGNFPFGEENKEGNGEEMSSLELVVERRSEKVRSLQEQLSEALQQLHQAEVVRDKRSNNSKKV